MSNDKFTGIIPALITPSDKNDQIDIRALEAHVQYLLQKGVSGLYLTGSTGEGFQMDIQERNEVIRHICSIVNKQIPVIAHTGAISTRQAIQLSQAAQEAGADGISSVPPFYYHFTETEIVDFYKDLASSTDLPLFIYNIPQTTKVDISLKTLTTLFEQPSIIGIKFTSTDIYKMERIIKLSCRPIVFSGSDEMSYYGLWGGAHALVGSSYNLLADTALAMYQAFQEQDYIRAHENYSLASELLNILLQFPYFSALRKLIEWDGCSVGTPRKPFAPLEHSQEKELRIKIQAILTQYPNGVSSLRKSLLT